MLGRARLMLVAVAALAAVPALAQDYPAGPVTIVVPFSPGGGVDLGARNLADGLSKRWKQSVVVENDPGGGSLIGTAKVSQAKPDGLTILYDSGAFTTLPAIKPSLPYNPLKDFKPIASAGEALVVIAVGPGVKAKDFKEFIEETKQRTVFVATSGSGSLGHLLGEAINLSAGIEMSPVHYKSGSESLIDVAGGRADVYIGPLPAVMPLLSTGKVRILATMGRNRVDSLPDVPTLAELGYKNVELSAWWGLFAPSGTADQIVNKINTDVQAVLAMPEYKKYLKDNEADLYPRSASEFKDFVVDELGFWRRVVKERGIVQQ